jgi:hypothetical protein
MKIQFESPALRTTGPSARTRSCPHRRIPRQRSGGGHKGFVNCRVETSHCEVSHPEDGGGGSPYAQRRRANRRALYSLKWSRPVRRPVRARAWPSSDPGAVGGAGRRHGGAHAGGRPASRRSARARSASVASTGATRHLSQPTTSSRLPSRWHWTTPTSSPPDSAAREQTSRPADIVLAAFKAIGTKAAVLFRSAFSNQASATTPRR